MSHQPVPGQHALVCPRVLCHVPAASQPRGTRPSRRDRTALPSSRPLGLASPPPCWATQLWLKHPSANKVGVAEVEIELRKETGGHASLRRRGSTRLLVFRLHDQTTSSDGEPGTARVSPKSNLPDPCQLQPSYASSTAVDSPRSATPDSSWLTCGTVRANRLFAPKPLLPASRPFLLAKELPHK